MWTLGGNYKLKSWLRDTTPYSPVVIFCSVLSSALPQKEIWIKLNCQYSDPKGARGTNSWSCLTPHVVVVWVVLMSWRVTASEANTSIDPADPHGATCRSVPYQSPAPRSTDRAWRFLSWPLSRALIWPFTWKDKGIPHCPLGSQGGPRAWVIKVCFKTRPCKRRVSC